MSTREHAMSGPHLVLIGLMGAGKTTVGRRAAARLSRDFVDTDDIVVAHAGTSIAEIFRAGGEPRFRALERVAVADACASPAPLVIACGGGAVLDPENRRVLRAAGVVVWLRAPAALLAARVGDGAARPLLEHDAAGTLARLEQLREPAYEAAAHTVVDVDGLDVDAVTDAVLEAYEGVRA
jgi:shikimate kinase